jgi:hypothetical protein
MDVKKIAVCALIGSLSAIATAIAVYRKKLNNVHAEGWFSGFSEAARDYEKEIKHLRCELDRAERKDEK